MKNNVAKIKLGMFVIVGFVTLAGFSTTFGYTRTINNKSPHHIAGVIHYVGGRPDDTFSIASQGSYGVNSIGYLVKEIDVTVYPNWNESTSNVLANVFSTTNARQKTQASLNNVAGGINIAWKAATATAKQIGSGVEEYTGISSIFDITKQIGGTTGH